MACQMVCEIDLLPYLTVEIEDYGTFTIDESQQVIPDFPEELSDLLWEEDSDSLDIKVFIDWSNLEIPVLAEPLLELGEATIFNDHYFNTEISPAEIAAFAADQGDPNKLAGFDVADYGWNDREGGYDITMSDLFDDIETDASKVVFR